jgi:spermidine synthase
VPRPSLPTFESLARRSIAPAVDLSHYHGMRARELLGSGTTPDGIPITLHSEGAGYVVRLANEVLMSSRLHGSESAMAAASLEPALRSPRPRVLIGGLGMGYTLRATLDVLPRKSDVVVAELLPCVVDWNRGPLAALSSNALDDPRVHLEVADVRSVVASPRDGFDAIMLDVDNGPDAFTMEANSSLYRPAGLALLRAALRPGGVLSIWSASPSRAFEKALATARFAAETMLLPARQGSVRGARHTLFLGRIAREPRRRG